MHPAVDLDDQLQRQAGEVHDIGPDRMLTPHPPPIDGPAA
jgi:hypothetical protein